MVKGASVLPLTLYIIFAKWLIDPSIKEWSLFSHSESELTCDLFWPIEHCRRDGYQVWDQALGNSDFTHSLELLPLCENQSGEVHWRRKNLMKQSHWITHERPRYTSQPPSDLIADCRCKSQPSGVSLTQSKWAEPPSWPVVSWAIMSLLILSSYFWSDELYCINKTFFIPHVLLWSLSNIIYIRKAYVFGQYYFME